MVKDGVRWRKLKGEWVILDPQIHRWRKYRKESAQALKDVSRRGRKPKATVQDVMKRFLAK